MAGTKLNTMIVGAIALLLAISAAIVVVPWNRTTGAAVASAAAPAVTSDQDWRTRFDETYMLKEGEVLKRVAPPFIPEREFFWDDYARALAERGGRSAQHSYPLVFFRQNETLQLSAVVSGSQASIGTILNFGFRLNSYEWDDSPAFDLRLSGDWVIRDNADVASLMSALGSILRSEFNRPLRFVSRPTAQQVVIVTGRYAYRRIADPAGAPEVVHITIGPPADSTGRRGIVRGSLQTFLESAGHHVRLRFIDQTDQPSLVNLFWIEHESAAALATMKPGPEKDAAITQLLNSLHSQTGLTYTLEWQTLPVWYLASAPSDLILFADRPVPEDSVIDLDTGAVLAMPADIQWFGRDLGPRLEWTKRTGGDVWVHTVGNPVGIDGRANDLGGLFGCDMVVEPVAPSFWDGATLELITSRLQGKPHIVDQAMRPMGRFPATFLFKTRSGAIGILQIMSFNQDPRSAVIRYKVSP